MFVIVTFSSLNVIVATTSPFVEVSGLYVIVATGLALSIQLTTAFAVPLFPDGPTNLNSYSPFSVNVCVFPPSTVTFCLSNVIVAVTSPFVGLVVLYVIVGTGTSLSIQLTSARAVPLSPFAFSNANSYCPFCVNVYWLLPPLFTIFTFSWSKLIVATTSVFTLDVPAGLSGL